MQEISLSMLMERSRKLIWKLEGRKTAIKKEVTSLPSHEANQSDIPNTVSLQLPTLILLFSERLNIFKEGIFKEQKICARKKRVFPEYSEIFVVFNLESSK